ncbi:MAG: outer membrane beta-barrel protein [Myxococcales bacterium]|nr:outer membrane beta-barrel protein [Myxococcales bacterium]
MSRPHPNHPARVSLFTLAALSMAAALSPWSAALAEEPQPAALPSPADSKDADTHGDADGRRALDTFLEHFTYQLSATGYYQLDAARTPNSLPMPSYRAFVDQQGFGLTFAGVDAAYETDTWGLTLSLRFGPGADKLIGTAPAGLNNLRQGYVTWKPTSKLKLDLGWFDTIYGAEVADEWKNLNFTRGALYFLMQPFNHTGLRAAYQVNEKVAVTVLVVNGFFDFPDITDLANEVPHFGGQIAITPNDHVGLYLGYGTGPNGLDDNRDWDHFVDVVANLSSGRWHLALNGDLRVDPSQSTALYYGASAAVGVDVGDHWALALRGEYLGDPDGLAGLGTFADETDDAPAVSLPAKRLGTGTLTVRYSPVPQLVITLENRVEVASADIFSTRSGPGASDVHFATILGVSGHVGN